MFKENADAAGICIISSWLKSRTFQAFSGIAYTEDSIIIGQAGFDAYASSENFDLDQFKDGRFSFFSQDADSAHAFSDFMGQEIIFYFNEGSEWAASNSFLYLAEYLQNQGVKLTPNRVALVPYLAPSSLTQQLVSEATGIQEIRILPATSRISVESGSFSIRDRLTSNERPVQGFTAYTEGLINYAEKWVARCAALLQEYPSTSKVDITGGRDSRVILALIAASEINLSKINFCSNKSFADDYKVSSALSKRLNFSIRNTSIPSSRASPEAMYDMWKYGNLGVYFPVYIAGGITPSDTLHFHGAGGGCLREVYPAGFIDSFASQLPVPKSLKEAVQREISGSLATWGLDDGDSLKAGLLHYRNCRSRMHFGRNWFRSLFGTLVTPISSYQLVLLSEALSRQQRERAQIYCDLMLLCKPELAVLPFDTQKKSFSRETLESSPFFKTRPKLTRLVGSMKIYRGAQHSVDKSVTFPAIDPKRQLARDVKIGIPYAASLEIFPKDYEAKVISDLAADVPLSKGGQKAAHYISAAEIAKLCI